MADQEPFVVDPGYVPPPLSAQAEFEVQCILDAAARRILEQRLKASECVSPPLPARSRRRAAPHE
jgi:hypothetical protein